VTASTTTRWDSTCESVTLASQSRDEVEFEWLDGFDLEEPEAVNRVATDNPGGPFDAKGGVGEVWSFTVNQKAFLSTGKFQPFILLGLGVLGAADSQASDPDNPNSGRRRPTKAAHKALASAPSSAAASTTTLPNTSG
jgi:hypothetical protein